MDSLGSSFRAPHQVGDKYRFAYKVESDGFFSKKIVFTLDKHNTEYTLPCANRVTSFVFGFFSGFSGCTKDDETGLWIYDKDKLDLLEKIDPEQGWMTEKNASTFSLEGIVELLHKRKLEEIKNLEDEKKLKSLQNLIAYLDEPQSVSVPYRLERILVMYEQLLSLFPSKCDEKELLSLASKLTGHLSNLKPSILDCTDKEIEEIYELNKKCILLNGKIKNPLINPKLEEFIALVDLQHKKRDEKFKFDYKINEGLLSSEIVFTKDEKETEMKMSCAQHLLLSEGYTYDENSKLWIYNEDKLKLLQKLDYDWIPKEDVEKLSLNEILGLLKIHEKNKITETEAVLNILKGYQQLSLTQNTKELPKAFADLNKELSELLKKEGIREQIKDFDVYVEQALSAIVLMMGPEIDSNNIDELLKAQKALIEVTKHPATKILESYLPAIKQAKNLTDLKLINKKLKDNLPVSKNAKLELLKKDKKLIEFILKAYDEAILNSLEQKQDQNAVLLQNQKMGFLNIIRD